MHAHEMPAQPADLHLWLREQIGLVVPTVPLIAGHASPFDYLVHAFFEEPPPQRAACPRSSQRDCVVWANRGGGKTFLGAVATMLDLLFKPTIQIRILGGSLEQSRRMHAHLCDLFQHDTLRPALDGRITRSRVRLANGSSCEVLAQSQTSVRGTRVQKLRCDEVELFDPEIWEAAQLTTMSKRCGSVLVRGCIECLSTMHLPHGIMYRIVREAEGGARRLFKWGVVDVLGACDEDRTCSDETGDCPLLEECGGRAKQRDAAGEPAGHLSVDDAISLKRRVGEHTWQSEMLCLRPSRSDSVYPEFDAQVHVVSALPRDRDGWTHIAGMDFGFRAPTVILQASADPDGTLFVEQEFVRTGAVLAEHIRSLEAISRTRPIAWVGVDPAGRQRNDQTGLSNIQQIRRAGFRVCDRVLPLHQGIELVRARLRPAGGAQPRLLIHERCEHLIQCMERYRYPRDRPESIQPVKDGSDHAPDALRYLVQNLDRPTRTSRSRYIP